MHTVGAAAAILHNGQVLLVRRNDVPVWALPGGGVELGETVEVCCVREAKEETGLDVEIDRLVGLYARRRGFGKAMNLTFLFCCHPVGGTLRTSGETNAVRYWPIQELPKSTLAWHRGFLADALAQNHQATWRTVSIPRWKILIAWPILRLRWFLNRLAGKGKHTTVHWQLGTGVTVFDAAGSVLLVLRRDYPVWNLPGGAVECKETPWDAAVREAREETGLDVLIHRLTGIYSKPTRGEIVLNFDAQTAGGQLVPTSEGVAGKFFPLDKLPDQTLPKHVERIRHSAARNGKIEFLVQDSPPGLSVLGFKDREC